jgi:spermidine/putrescine transport system permease protein
MYVWGVARVGLPMQVNVVGTLMLVVSLAIVLTGEINSRRRARALT